MRLWVYTQLQMYYSSCFGPVPLWFWVGAVHPFKISGNAIDRIRSLVSCCIRSLKPKNSSCPEAKKYKIHKIEEKYLSPNQISIFSNTIVLFCKKEYC